MFWRGRLDGPARHFRLDDQAASFGMLPSLNLQRLK